MKTMMNMNCNYWALPGVQTVEVWEKNTPNLSTPEAVLNEICRLTGADANAVKSASRKRETVVIRQAYCYAARLLTKASCKEIGRVISRYHATVIHSCREIANGLSVNDEYIIETINKIKNILE